MTALERLGAFVADCATDERDRAAARLHTADTLGAWIAATATAEGRALLGHRQSDAPLTDRVAIHCALARLSEIDDIHLGAMVTPGSIVVPAALTIAADQPNSDAADVAAAIVAGYEAMVRLGAAIDGPSVLYRGIWPSYFAAPFGVAAVAARLLRLDARQAANALSIALIAAAPGTGHHAAVTTARWLAVGQAAGRGLQAARAAQAGFTSNLALADGEYLKGIYGIVPDAKLLGDGWEEPALHRVSFKPWCAARQTMAATQALKELIAGGVAANAIERIEAAVLPPHGKMIDHGVTAGDRFSYLTSAPYQMALAALSPDAAHALSAPAGPVAPHIAAMMARITLRADEGLLAEGYPQAWPARVTLTAGGQRHERTVTHVPGDPARPWGEADLRRKFERAASPLLDRERAAALFASALAAPDRPGEWMLEFERLAVPAR
jgi:2-methylcitrate dehydratase PrpD